MNRKEEIKRLPFVVSAYKFTVLKVVAGFVICLGRFAVMNI